MKTKLYPLGFALVALTTPTYTFAETEKLDSISVTSDLRQVDAQEINASVEILDQRELQDRGASHFGDALLQIPNLNFSSSSSRPRHLQIRGMGERDEYTGAPNPSVGLMLDDIDFSGIGMLGSLFDVQQLEVLRGPQSTRYGASALAGLVNIKTNDPTPNNESLIETSLGQDGLHETGIMTSGAFSDKAQAPQYRVSIFKHNSDGFRKNSTLNLDDTNKKDELTARAKLRFWSGKDTQFDLTLLHANLNNGYDAWSPENTFTTLSDQPGKDTQETNAGSFKITHSGWNSADLISTTSYAQSDMLYSYDLDWEPTPQGFYKNTKERKNFSQEIRLISKQPIFNRTTDWLAGAYISKLEEKNDEQSFWGGMVRTTSDYTQSKIAGFGQLDFHLSQKTILTLGARTERVNHDFKSNLDSFAPGENLWGGSLGINHKLNAANNIFATLSRSYKAGGFNARLPDDDRPKSFVNETAYTLEIGHKLQTDTLKLSTTLFYTERKDAQFDGNEREVIGGVENWYFYIENFDKAKNYGLETEINWQATPTWNLFANLGLLYTELKGLSYNQAMNDNLVGRDQAHAPRYQFMLGTQYRFDNNWYARLDIQGMDKFYFDNIHHFQSRSYVLANARIGYEADSWEAYLWGKNLTDKEYDVRGLDRYGTGESINRELGNPRQVGATFRLYF